MLNQITRWTTWGIGGLFLFGMLLGHYLGWFRLPDFILMTVGFCFGMYFLMLLDTIAAEMAKRKKGG